jgi:hypothetical protein
LAGKARRYLFWQNADADVYRFDTIGKEKMLGSTLQTNEQTEGDVCQVK